MPRPGQAKTRKRKREAEMTSKAVGGIARATPSWSHQTSSIPDRNTLPVEQSHDGTSSTTSALINGEEYQNLIEGIRDGDEELDEDEYDDQEIDEDNSEAEEVEDIGDRAQKEKSKSKKGSGGGAQVLPVADLPDDWEGDIEDGPTYLALAMRADKALPTYTRVENPYLEESPTMGEDEAEDDPSEKAGPSRHPALPKESWQTLFPLHFVAYKKTIAESWPPSPPLPYPTTWPKIPPTSQRGEWGYYINGHPRKKLPPKSSGKGKSKAIDKEMDEEEGLNGGVAEEEDMEMDLDEDDEEAAMNLPQDPDAGLEPWGEKHKARDPHICILQKLDTHQIISVLITLTTHIQNTLTPLETDLIPPSYDPLASASSYRPHTRKNPFSEHYSRWIYALLQVLDPFLSAEQVSVLRELARVVMRVGAWRWVEAVVGGEVGLPASSSTAAAGGVDGSGDGEGEKEGRGTWMLGARWKYARDVREANGIAEEEMSRSAIDQIPPVKREEYDETGVDETLARCWLIVHAVSAGWGQKDLVMDLEEMFT